MPAAKIAAAALSALGALLLAEVAARRFSLDLRWMEPLVPVQVADLEVHRPSEDPQLLYELAPHTSLQTGDREVQINRLGFRGREREVEKPPGVVRILCLGSSNTYGARVSDGEGWPERLEEILSERARRPVEVWNLGVSGYMVRQEAALGIRALEEWDPDLILLQLYNTGRRFVLYGTDLPGLFERVPELWSEYLTGAPRGWLWDHSALLRAGVVGINRLQAGPERDMRLAEASAPADQEAVRALAEAAEGRAGLVALIPPSGAPDDPLKGSGVPVIDLSQRENPFGPEGREIHPPAPVYPWYAEQIAGELIQGRCLGAPRRCMRGETRP